MGSEAEPSPVAAGGPTWRVVCFCAQWCGVCREFRATFEALGRDRPELHILWVDVEDEEEIVGDLDVDTFPTILVAQGGEARFFGPVLPQAGVLVRLLDSLQAGDATSQAAGADAPAQALLERVLSSR